MSILASNLKELLCNAVLSALTATGLHPQVPMLKRKALLSQDDDQLCKKRFRTEVNKPWIHCNTWINIIVSACKQFNLCWKYSWVLSQGRLPTFVEGIPLVIPLESDETTVPKVKAVIESIVDAYNTLYMVKIYNKGIYTCTCKGFMESSVYCSHSIAIRIVTKNISKSGLLQVAKPKKRGPKPKEYNMQRR